VGIGAGIVGAILVALKYALRPPTKRRVPMDLADDLTTKVRHPASGRWSTTNPAKAAAGLRAQCRLRRFLLRVVEGVSGICRAASGDRTRLIGFGESARPRCA